MDKNGKIPVYSSESTNNGISGYTNNDADFIVDNKSPVYIVFGDHTRSFNIAIKSFCVMDNVKVISINNYFSIRLLMFIISSWKKCIPNLGYSRHWSLAQKALFKLPIDNEEIDFEFIEEFVSELEVERISELEAYLSATGLKDYILTKEEQQALDDFDKIDWKIFNLQQLFGKSTRGKRLKSADRITGNIPFVTAGEAEEGVSAFIGNNVTIFPANTITIDMFGSAKYRNYSYGGDDHIAVVHTEKLAKLASLFITSSIHKVSNAGQFSYSRNFYAKDADELNISLPTKNKHPNYDIMETLTSAVQKLVIKDVVLYADSKIKATKSIIEADKN